MDVTCERCGTEYEFDETLVSDRGTTVKCTNCGHLFKVHRPGARASESAKSWTVRKRDGTTITLSSLRDLQRLIARGELTERDMISRAGEGWKRLGDIAELSSFFTAAKSQPPAARKDDPPYARSPSSRPAPNVAASGPVAETHPYTRPEATTPDSPILRGAPIAEPPRAPPPAARTPLPPIRQQTPIPPRRQMTMIGVGEVDAASRPPAQAVSEVAQTTPMAAVVNPDRASSDRAGTRPLGGSGVPAASSSRNQRALTPTRVEEPDPARAAPKFRGPEPAARKPAKQPKLHFDEEDEPARRKKSGGGGKLFAVVALILLAGAGAGVGLAWDRIAPLVGIETGASGADEVGPMLEEAQAELARDDSEGYERSVRVLTRASAVADGDPRVLALLAQVNAAWAQSIAFEAGDIEVRAGADAVSTLRAQQNRKAEEAKRDAERALGAEPRNVRALVALANALRLMRDLDGAEQRLATAAEIEGRSATSAEWLYVSALVAMDRGGNVAAARSGAGQAVLRDPALVRAQMLYARALAADGDRTEAVAALDQVLQRQPGHGPATRLRALLADSDAGVADAAVVAEADEPDAAVVAANTTPDAATTPANNPPAANAMPRDYTTLVRRGNELVDEGNVGRARGMFEEAARIRPGAPEALTGLGYISLNAREIERAIGQFQPAANRGFAEAYLGLGEAFRQSGRPQQALEAYRRYLQISPGGREANVARRQIERLEAELGPSAGPGAAPGTTGPGATPTGTTEPPPGPGTTTTGTTEPPPGPGTTEPPPEPTPPPGPGTSAPLPEGGNPDGVDFTPP